MPEEIEVKKKEKPISDFFKTIFFPFKILWTFFSFVLKTITILIKIFFLTALMFIIIFGYNFYKQFSDLKEEGISKEKSVMTALDYSIEKANDYFDIARDKIKFIDIFSDSKTETDNIKETEIAEETNEIKEKSIIKNIKEIVEDGLVENVKGFVEEKNPWSNEEEVEEEIDYFGENFSEENIKCGVDILEDGSPNVLAICKDENIGFWYSDKDKNISQMKIKFSVKIPGFSGSQEFPWQTTNYYPKKNLVCGFEANPKNEKPDTSFYGESELYVHFQLIDSTGNVSKISSCQVF